MVQAAQLEVEVISADLLLDDQVSHALELEASTVLLEDHSPQVEVEVTSTGLEEVVVVQLSHSTEVVEVSLTGVVVVVVHASQVEVLSADLVVVVVVVVDQVSHSEAGTAAARPTTAAATTAYFILMVWGLLGLV